MRRNRSLEDQPRRSPSMGSFQRIVIAFALVASFALGLGVDRFSGPETDAASSFQDAPNYTTLEETWNLIQDNYVAIDDVNESDLIYGAATGMVEALGDTGHSNFQTPQQAKQFDQILQGEFVGIGVSLDYSTGNPVISYTFEGSPAQEAGIRSGDVITSIDGTITAGLKPEEIQSLLIGDEGEDVTLGISRPTTGESLEFTVTRAVIEYPLVTYAMLPNDVALINVSQYATGVTNELKSAIRAVKREGATAIILDLRNNGGGLVFEAIGVASQFVPEGNALYLYEERDADPRQVNAVPNGLWTEEPLVVLMNNNTASSSEMTIGGIMAADRGKSVGEATFGTGTILTPFDLEDGSSLVLGTAKWLLPDGSSAWHVGIQPDVPVSQPIDTELVVPSSDNDAITLDDLEASSDQQLKIAFNTVTGTDTFPDTK
jgi:carboxyl-terminal processing protease